MAALLDDGDFDVRILATELARNMPAAEANHVLCTLLEHEQHPNVCAAAIDVLAEVGTRDAVASASGVRRTVCRSPVSAIRRVHSHRSDFRRGRLGMAGPRCSRTSCRPRYPGGRPTTLRISLSPDRNVVCRDKRYYIDRRLAERIAATGSASFQSYFAMLRSDADQEIEHLVNAFTVNETYFYREEHQLRCMTSDLLGSAIRGSKSGESDPHLVDSLLDRRRALFDRDMADGELERGRQSTISRSSAPTSIPARSRPRRRASMASAPLCGSPRT